PAVAKDPKRGGRAIPRAAPRAASAKAKGGILSWRPRWIADIISELRKVVWPTRQDTIHLTVVVLIVSVVIGAALGGLDVGFAWLAEHILLR
ncbi:MAG: preprotein translocase subunit SecE, partial [Dehalococcoidia bacterium]|nr:preprotein translocase subunit SecE [Dehalococcoidia bacterium]